jgi:hypothetical protein
MPKKSKQVSERRNVWIRRDLCEAAERSKRHPDIPLQSVLDDLIESALRQRRIIPQEAATLRAEIQELKG